MRRAALALAAVPILAGLEIAAMTATMAAEGPAGSRLLPLAWSDLAGWAEDDHAAALAVFRRSCRVILDQTPALRPGLPTTPALVEACRAAPAAADAAQARAFFETRFTPHRIQPATERGFLTGYFEPEMDASPVQTAEFPVPVLGRPDDLVTLQQGDTAPGLPVDLAAARRTADGLVPYADRAAIEDGALAGRGLEIAFVRDRVELFIAQVQGSARVRFTDGRMARLVYAGRNGHPYTSIGRVIVSEGHMDLATMTLDTLKRWLRTHPDAAARIMRMNRSYIFLALRTDLDPAEGPIGAASVPLTPWRSIAVDRNLWPYGVPMFVSVEAALDGGQSPFRKLTIAQDTGSAILGAARADLFCGSGPMAGDHAGVIRHPLDMVVLHPRDEVRP